MTDAILEPDEVGEDEAGAVQPSADGPTPPYMSFTGFLSLLDKMIEHGPPDQIDRDFFGNVSGSTVAQTMSALRFFGLVDHKKKPQPRLGELVPPDTRKERLRKLIEEHYPWAVTLGSSKSTQAQLDEAFKARGLRRASATLRKAVTFYLQAAEFTEIPLSPYFSKSRPAANGGGTRRSTVAPRKTTPRKATPRPPADGATGATSLDLNEKKSKYIELLLKLAEDKDGTPNESVLNRLHTVLGYAEPEKGPRRRARGSGGEGGDRDGQGSTS